MDKAKILIAEDSRSMQMFYNTQLPDDRFDKRIAANGKEAINAYTLWKPDLIMLDINMPVMDGLNTLKAIREEMKDRSTPVIMVTSQSDKEKVLSCAKLGVQGYIAKPFKGQELLDKIANCLSAKKECGYPQKS